MSSFWLVLLLSASVATVQGITGPSSLALPNEYPFMVSILLRGIHHCGGFIYNENFILTTASCIVTVEAGNPPTVTPISPRDLSVVTGEHSFISIDEGEQTLPVIYTKAHENYDPKTQLYNLGLIEVGRAIEFNRYANFIPFDAVNPAVVAANIMGWGATADGSGLSTTLRKTTVSMVGDCIVYSGSASINETFIICAGSASDLGHPCNSDDGAPLVQNGIVVGLLSYQRNCGANPFYSAIYVRLSTHFSWIRGNAGFQPPPQTTTPTTTTFITTDRVITTTTNRGPFLCPPIDGYYPDPDDCNSYYVCISGIPFPSTCVPGTCFVVTGPGTGSCQDNNAP